MRGKAARLIVRPRLEILESKTLLSSFGVDVKGSDSDLGDHN